jgi:hypothetical protein
MYTPNELEVFRYCFKLLSEGCKTSFEAERALRKKFWWVTHFDSERLVKRFWKERHKIEEVLTEIDCNEIQNVQTYNVSQGGAECRDPCCSPS